jgi:hypothetical protein
MSDRGIALAMTAMRYGEVVDDPENLKNLATASGPVRFIFAHAKHQVRGTKGSKEPRDATAFHVRADDLARKARRVSGSNEDDARWLLAMAEAWMASLAGKSLRDAWLYASSRCRVAGETAFFKKVLEPIIEYRFQLRLEEPCFSPPDFNPHDAT